MAAGWNSWDDTSLACGTTYSGVLWRSILMLVMSRAFRCGAIEIESNCAIISEKCHSALGHRKRGCSVPRHWDSTESASLPHPSSTCRGADLLTVSCLLANCNPTCRHIRIDIESVVTGEDLVDGRITDHTPGICCFRSSQSLSRSSVKSTASCIVSCPVEGIKSGLHK